MDNYIDLSLVDELLTRNGLAETVGFVAFFAGDLPDLGTLRARVAERWGGETRLRLVLEPPPNGYRRLTGRPRWAVTDGFDPAEHVLPVAEVAGPAAEDPAANSEGNDGGNPAGSLDELIAGQLCRPMPAGSPPWRLLPVRGVQGVRAVGDVHGVEEARGVPDVRGVPDGGFALVLLAHHALLDGSSLMTLFRLLLDGPAEPTRSMLPQPRRAPKRQIDLARLIRALNAELRPGGPLPGPRESPAHTEVALAVLDHASVRAARSLPSGAGATLSELLLCCAAGALRSAYGHTETADGRDAAPVQASIPVDLRTRETAHELGNIVSAVRVPLPSHTPTPHARLTACRQLLTEVRSRGREENDVTRIVEAANRMGPWVLASIAARGYSPAYAAVGTTALKWRNPQCALDHRPLLRIAALPPLHRPGTVNFGAVACGRTVTLAVVSHAERGAARRLADAVGHELELLAAQV
ncbi:wax ester/triacylglycerol synthase domain-containing protein [Streptomyces phaeochromogenes]|uniref:wax ester/triacylglycerol synthase domain-containing protein n=1 Tax=Streptomyces phaeochromogenes TaxID=1923 RepID=UPI0033DA720D